MAADGDDGLLAPLGVQRNAHSSDVNAVAWHSSGRLASAGDDGMLKVWTLA